MRVPLVLVVILDLGLPHLVLHPGVQPREDLEVGPEIGLNFEAVFSEIQILGLESQTNDAEGFQLKNIKLLLRRRVSKRSV